MRFWGGKYEGGGEGQVLSYAHRHNSSVSAKVLESVVFSSSTNPRLHERMEEKENNI